MRVDPERVAELFALALERPAGERTAFLDRSCAAAPALRAEIDSLLAAHSRGGSFLDETGRTDIEGLLAQPAAEGEPAGRRVGPYRLLHELGRGGMGVVHLAERVEGGFAQRAAVKLVKRGMDTDAILRRFLRERQILAGLEHPNVARLLDGGATEDGQPYFAMEYVEGEPLTAYCDGRGLGVEERLRLFEDAARAVQYAHAQLVVHRDLKPSNILVTGDGQLKLLDFGVAKLLAADGEAEDTALTRGGLRPLTPEYAAPEQIRGEPITIATDVYALGLVLYELLAGRRPFAGTLTGEALAKSTCETDPQAPSVALGGTSRQARRLRGDLDAVVLRALRKEPSRRYASAEALAEDVRRHRVGQPVTARPDSVRYRAAKFVRRHRVGVGAAAAATLSLLVGLLGTAWQARVAARERDRARLEAERAEKVKEFLIGLFQSSDPTATGGETVTLREVLDRGTERIDRELEGHPALQAELFDTIGGISQTLARYDQAAAVGERALALARQVHGPQHVRVAHALESLGVTHRLAGRRHESEALLREAAAMYGRLLPPDSVERAECLNRLGQTLRLQRKLDEAEGLHREAAAILERKLGPEHLQTLPALSGLADVLTARGRHAEAAALFEKILGVRRRAMGPQDPMIASSLSMMGAALYANGDWAAAEAAHREALRIRIAAYGEGHPRVAETLLHVATTLAARGDPAGAEPLFRQSLAIDRQARGRHPTVASTLNNLAHALASQGCFAEAMPLFDEAIALHRQVSGAQSLQLAAAIEFRAAALVEQGRAREAVPLLEESLEIGKWRTGPPTRRVAGALGRLARAKSELGRTAEAEPLFREAIDLHARAQAKPNVDTAEARLHLGELLARTGRAGEAEPLLREALAHASRNLEPGHWRLGEMESALGACLFRLGRHDEARTLLAAGYERLLAARGKDHPATRRAQRRLRAS